MATSETRTVRRPSTDTETVEKVSHPLKLAAGESFGIGFAMHLFENGFEMTKKGTQMKVIALPFNQQAGEFDHGPLDRFLQTHRVFTQSDHLFELNGQVYVALVLHEEAIPANGQRPTASPAPKQGEPAKTAPAENGKNGGERPTYQPEMLSPEQMQVFEKLREWRYARSKEMGLAPYVICSNRELEQIILRQPRTTGELAAIKGMSEARVTQHGEMLLKMLRQLSGDRTG